MCKRTRNGSCCNIGPDTRTGLRLTQCYDLRPLPAGLRLELAYALQCRLECATNEKAGGW